MTNEINYTPTHWNKGDVLTAEKLNNIENVLDSVVQKVNGGTKDSNGNIIELDPSEQIASRADVATAINDLSTENQSGTTIQTITNIKETQGKIIATYSDIAKATSSNLGLVSINTENLTINENGLLGIKDSPNFSGNLEIGTAPENNNYNLQTANTANFNANLVINGITNVNNTFNITSGNNANFGGTLTVSDTFTANSKGTFNNGLEVASGDFNVKSTATLSNDFHHRSNGYKVTRGQETIYYQYPHHNFYGHYKNIYLGSVDERNAPIYEGSSNIILQGDSTEIRTSNNDIQGITNISNLYINKTITNDITNYSAILGVNSENHFYDNTIIDSLITTNATITNIEHGFNLVQTDVPYIFNTSIGYDNNGYLSIKKYTTVNETTTESNISLFDGNTIYLYTPIQISSNGDNNNLVETIQVPRSNDTPLIIRTLTNEGNEYISGDLSVNGNIIGDIQTENLTIKTTNNGNLNFQNYNHTTGGSRYEYGYKLQNTGTDLNLTMTTKYYQVSGNATPTSTTNNYIGFGADGSISITVNSETITLTKDDITHLHTLWNNSQS